MWRLFKLIVVLLGIGFVALTGYAYFGDIEPDPSERVEPVTLGDGG